MHRAPAAPLDASAARPPAASARRHRFALIRDTRNRFATSRSLAPALDHLRGGQPHLFPAGPLRRVQAAAIGVPHASGLPHRVPGHQAQ